VSSDWQTLALGDVAEFVRGINFKPDDVVPTGTPGSVACMRTKNVQTELDLSDVWSVGEQFVRREDQFLQAGDILVSSANSWNLVGKCCWIPELPGRASFGGFVSVLRPHRAKADPRFLFRWFSSNRIQTTLRSFGQQTTNISNLNTDRCLRLEIPLPPLAEQRRIAEVLDKAEALRAKRRAALAQLDSLTQSLFLDLFGDPIANERNWPIKMVKDFVAGFESGKSIVADDEDDTTSACRVLKVSAVTSLEFRPEQSKPLPPNYEPPPSHRVQAGDLLFSRANTAELIGATAFVHSTPPNLFLPDKLWRFVWHNEPKADSHFVRFLFQQPKFHIEISQRASGTSGSMKNISQDKVLTIKTGLPPLDLQREFARRVTAVEKLKTAQRAALAELDALFASLQHRAFRGEL
jgi:type I restriction enzyme S subunit